MAKRKSSKIKIFPIILILLLLLGAIAGFVVLIKNVDNSNHSWWDKLWEYGWSYPKNEALDETHTNVSPFEEVKKTSLSSSSIASDLLINENDVTSFKSFCNMSYGKNEVPYLFRFAVSDYTSRPITSCTTSGSNEDSYLAQETVFFDFNIITMTFKGEEDYYTLAVMHTPVDVISGIKAPDVELTPGEQLVNKTLSAIQELWNKFLDSDFLKALKIIGMIIVGAIIALILIKVIGFFIGKFKKSKRGGQKQSNVTVVIDSDSVKKQLKANSLIKKSKKVKNVQKKE